LDIPYGELFPISTGRIENISLFMEAKEETDVTLHLKKTERTCDFIEGDDIVGVTSKVIPGKKDWVDFKISVEVCPKSLCWITLDRNPSVTLYGSGLFTPTGTAPLFKPYQRWLYLKPGLEGGWNLSLRIEPEQFPYEPENILSGVTRSDYWTNIWVSDPNRPLPQWSTLEFESPLSFNAIHLTFDTNLSLFQNLHLPTWRAPKETVKDYRVLYEYNGKWKEIGIFRDNFLRYQVHRFHRITADKVKIEVLSTWGCPSARIFQIRVYDE